VIATETAIEAGTLLRVELVRGLRRDVSAPVTEVIAEPAMEGVRAMIAETATTDGAATHTVVPASRAHVHLGDTATALETAAVTAIGVMATTTAVLAPRAHLPHLLPTASATA
jgi:hypothetical protein